MKKITYTLKFFFISVFFLAVAGCGGGGSSPATKVTVNLGVPKTAQSVNKLKAQASSSIPSSIVSVKITIFSSDMSTIERVVNVSGRTDVVEVFDVPTGTKRNFQASASASDGSVIYQGNVTADLDGSPQTIVIGVYGTVTACQNLVNQSRIPEARDICVSAADSFGSTVSTDADVTRFFSAFSRIAVSLLSVSSDGNPNNGLNTIGDILDSLGCNATRDPSNPKGIVCPRILPSGAPTGVQLQAFINSVIRPELEGAAEDLDMVSQSFDETWVEPFGGTQVKSDYGDVLALRAFAKSFLGAVIIENSYNLDADIAKAVNLRRAKLPYLVADNPQLLKLSTATELSIARNSLGSGLDDTLSAINWRQTHTGNQGKNLISLNVPLSQINNAKRSINEFKASLSGPSDMHSDAGAFSGTLDLTKFFVGVDLRSLMPPILPGHFPDPTFKGIWTNYAPGTKNDPNHDFNGDGIPDVLGRNF